MKSKILPQLTSFLGLVLLFMMGCNTDPCKDVAQPINPLPFGEQVHQYLDRDHNEEGGSIVKGQYVAYFDLSDGMEYAYTSSSIKSNLQHVAQMVTANNWEVYGLEAGKVKSMKDDNWSPSELFNRIVYMKNTGIMAPIEEALNQIVEEKKPALIITDFEEYRKDGKMNATGVERQAYAKPYFESWLRMGGIIKFYTMDFNENKLNKKLFFVVFDANDQQLVRDIEHALQRSGEMNYAEYLLQTTPYKVFTDYPIGKGGNFVRPNGADPLGFEFETFDGLNTEAYHITRASWLQAAEVLMSYRTNARENYNGLLSKLYVDLSDTQSVNIERLSLKVSDVTEDFNSFTNHNFAKKFAPAKGENGMVELTCEKTFFYDEKGELLPYYQYNPKSSMDITNECFLEINQAQFDQSYRANPKRTEVVIDFGREYSDSTLFSNTNGDYQLLKRSQVKDKLNGRVLRVDVCIAECGVADSNYSQLENFFNFESYPIKNGQKNKREKLTNDCISQSVDLALHELQKAGSKEQNRVIYTYFIKDTPQNDYDY